MSVSLLRGTEVPFGSLFGDMERKAPEAFWAYFQKSTDSTRVWSNSSAHSLCGSSFVYVMNGRIAQDTSNLIQS